MNSRTGKGPTSRNIFYYFGHPFVQLILFLLRSIARVFSTLSTLPSPPSPNLLQFPLTKKRGRGRPRLPFWVKPLRHLHKFLAQIIRALHRFSHRLHPSSIRKHRLLSRKYRLLSKSYLRAQNTIVVFQSTRFQFLKKLKPRRRYLALLALITVPAIIVFYFEILRDLPSPSRLATDRPIVSTKIYDRNGTLLYKIFKNENRSIVALDDIPLVLQQATIAIEDKNFYQHSGFSIQGIARAFKTNLTEDSLQGGSTITQQLVKNTLLSPERTLSRKIKEVILSVLTEFYFSKTEILTMYFNQVPYGSTAYGAEEASQMYFGQSVRQLTLAQSAFLAGLPAAPTRFSPYGIHPELAVVHQHEVLRRMVEDGYITLAQAEDAKNQKITLRPQQNDILAPHFVMYIKDLLVEKYGLPLVEQGGLEVYTSLDLTAQTLAQQVVTNEVATLKRLNVTNGAALVTNPATGEILAMVGSKDYFDTQSDGQVNVTLRPRQPGSSIKPVNYAAALEKGFTPATLIPDTPICYRLPGQPDYCPKNYDNRYHGLVTVRTALASSYNIPAVKTLSQIGVETMLEKGREMGITTWEDSSRFGLSLTLGGGEVKMVDMATAYAAFANGGLKVNLHPILEVRTYDGRVLERLSCKDLTGQSLSPITSIDAATQVHTCAGTPVITPTIAYQITNILSDNNARAPAFGTHSVLVIPDHQVAVKTGTTNNLRDNWTIGYTPDYLVVTWVGNNDNTPMSYIASGITGASPIWQKIMLNLLKDRPNHPFTPGSGLTKVSICTLTGTLSCTGCPSVEEYFVPGTEPKTHCTKEQIDTIRQNQDSLNRGRDRLLEGISTQN